MKPISLGEFAELCGGRVESVDPSTTFSGFATDSRDVAADDLFLAIRGANVDGHDYVESAMRSGATAALVERSIGGPSIVVDDIVAALASFASAKRDRFEGPVLGITGSTGKTSTKEMAAATLAKLGPVLRNPGNRNTEYTLPLAWADLDDHGSAAMEMAMRGKGQIDHLASFVKPTVAMITNIGTAHVEMVGSRDGIAHAKAEMLGHLPADGTSVFWADDDFLDFLKERAPGPILTFGLAEHADARVSAYRIDGLSGSTFDLKLDGRVHSVRLPLLGRHHAINAAAATIASVAMGVKPDDAVQGLSSFEAPPMRMQVVTSLGPRVIVDTYNANPESMRAALETLAETTITGVRGAVLGEMRELGELSEQAHRELGASLGTFSVRRALFVGPTMALAAEEAHKLGLEATHMTEVDHQAIREFLRSFGPQDLVLVKGSRALELERAL